MVNALNSKQSNTINTINADELELELVKSQLKISELESKIIELEQRPPEELLDLVRFLANVWNDANNFVYKNCDSRSLAMYIDIQGGSNQINIKRIAEQDYAAKNLPPAVNWLLSNGKYK